MLILQYFFKIKLRVFIILRNLGGGRVYKGIMFYIRNSEIRKYSILRIRRNSK